MSASENAAWFQKATGVSHETVRLLKTHLAMLREASSSMNLVAPGDLPHLWRRHVMDSAQLARLAPESSRLWMDLGSGAGFPGITLAILLRDRPGFAMHLVEKSVKKSLFLERVIRKTGVPARLINARLEEIAHETAPKPDVLTARALAPLPRLLTLAHPFFAPQTVGLFPKGRNLPQEMRKIEGRWTLKHDSLPSCADPEARILRVRNLNPVLAREAKIEEGFDMRNRDAEKPTKATPHESAATASRRPARGARRF